MGKAREKERERERDENRESERRDSPRQRGGVRSDRLRSGVHMKVQERVNNG